MKPARKILTFKQFRNRQKHLLSKLPASDSVGIDNPHAISDVPKEIHVGTARLIESRKQ